ncbi:ATP synthase F0 subunit B [candidate division WOR-1 bacterium RIFOXYB2_FULL_48_7]|uniref:ATP synthase subunit b n=1 Tax=candidate division WOR-1 bacterium RIFOXYB2_FULL_48_7 TaxID=1802583 RepID=A0A1F4TIM3_UNCSA|nr:MAG: ATP synthase F0 subunit B [candidate division WOR-1 bacterium RIFOXYB2_FULL_48_7]
MLELETGLIFWTAVTFGALVLILYKFALPPLIQMLDERVNKIERELKTAAQERQEADVLLRQQKELLSTSRDKAEKIVQVATAAAEKERQEILARAGREALLMVEQARLDSDQEKDRVKKELLSEAAEIVTQAASKLLGRVVTLEDNRRLVDESIKAAQ